MNKNNNDLIFIDFPDPDNFLMVLYCAKQLKNGETLDVVLSSRPVNLSYAPFYHDELMSKFNEDFIFPINNKNREKELKKTYQDFEKWFNIDEINYEDTNLIFDINVIRLNKFLKKEGLKNVNINFFRSKENIPNVGMRHHFHKMEWSYDLEINEKNKLNEILKEWKNNKIPISKKYHNEIVNILNNYKSLNKEYIVNIHNFNALNEKYDTFLIGGPFTDVKEIIEKKYTKTKKIIAMSSAIYTGTFKNTNKKNKPNLFDDQFNNYVDLISAKYVLEQDIETILIPTETTKPWNKIKNNYALTFSSKDILSWGENISNLFMLYNGKLDDKKEYSIFDLVVPIYYYSNIKINNKIKQKIHKIYKNKNDNIIVECNDNKDIIIKEDIKKDGLIWEGDNKYIIVGNLDIEKYEDKRLLDIKYTFIKEANKYLKK